ncbi:MAG: type II toxin-antitoxin system VapC family toxin [Ignavibacteria bacterium]
MKIPKIYIDTSVIGGCFDTEFRVTSRKLFDRIKLGLYKGLISEITINELEDAPDKVKEFMKDFSKDELSLLKLNEDVNNLALKYISEAVVSEKYFGDAMHIAIATIYDVDILVSWNFKHIVNYNRIKKFNAINLKEGYKVLEIRSPKDLFYE